MSGRSLLHKILLTFDVFKLHVGEPSIPYWDDFTGDEQLRIYLIYFTLCEEEAENLTSQNIPEKIAKILQKLRYIGIAYTEPPIRRLLFHFNCRLPPLPVGVDITGALRFFFVPQSAVRLRRNSKNLYCVSISAKNRKMLVTSFYQLCTMTDSFHKVGHVAITKWRENNGCCSFVVDNAKSAEFCVDEVKKVLYVLRWCATTKLVTIIEHKLKLDDQGKFSFATGSKPEEYTGDLIEELRYFPVQSQNTSTNCVGKLMNKSEERSSMFCSQFSIRQHDSTAFAFTVFHCLLDGEAFKHFEFVFVGVTLDRNAHKLLVTDCCLKTCNFGQGKDGASSRSICQLDLQLKPELWVHWQDRLIGSFMQNVFIHQLKRMDFVAPFQVDGCFTGNDGNYYLSTNENFDIIPENGVRLIGRLGKWLVLVDDCFRQLLLVHLPAVIDGRVLNVQQRFMVKIKFSWVQESFVDNEKIVSMWIGHHNTLFIQTSCSQRQKESVTRLHRFSCGDILLELSFRQCAHCGKLEEKRYRIDQKYHQSTLKVCRICKAKKLHKNWLVNRCHFCSVECFRNDWIRHKRSHARA